MISSDVPPVFGPAMNGMLLSKDKLGIIARETAIDACQLISEGSQEKQMEPLEARHRQILEIGRKPKMPDTFESLQTSIFAPLSGTKIVPPIGSGIPLRRDRQAFQESLPKIFAEKKLALKSFNLVKLSNLVFFSLFYFILYSLLFLLPFLSLFFFWETDNLFLLAIIRRSSPFKLALKAKNKTNFNSRHRIS